MPKINFTFDMLKTDKTMDKEELEMLHVYQTFEYSFGKDSKRDEDESIKQESAQNTKRSK